MKILLSAYACGPDRGSESGYAWNLACSLAKRGHNVNVLTMTRNKDLIDQELKKMDLPNLHFHFLKTPTEGAFFHKYIPYELIYYIWQRVARTYAEKLFPDADLIHHVTWGTLKVGSYLWKLNKPFIFGPVGGGQVADPNFFVFFGKYWKQELFRTLQTRLLRFLPDTKKLVKNTDLFLAANLETLKLIGKIKKTGVGQVQLFCDSALPEKFIQGTYPRRSPAGYLRILWIGRIISIKGLNFALYTLGKVKTPFKLTILGDGILRDKISEWVSQNGLEGRVEYLGQVKWEVVKEYYATQDVLLFTSLRESFGGQLLEAMAYGLPIVTLNQFGARNFVPEDAGFKVDVTVPEETANLLARAIERLWLEPALRERMGLVGYDYAKTQTWDRKIIEIENIYRYILKR